MITDVFSDLTKLLHWLFLTQAWELSTKMQTVCRERKSGGTTTTKTGSTDFSSAPNTQKTIKAHSHAAMACFSHLIVNTAATVALAGRQLFLHTSTTCFS